VQVEAAPRDRRVRLPKRQEGFHRDTRESLAPNTPTRLAIAATPPWAVWCWAGSRLRPESSTDRKPEEH
jgi:hypothetical protein